MEVYDYIGLKAYDEIHALDTVEKKGIKKGKELGKNEVKIKIAKNLLILKTVFIISLNLLSKIPSRH